MIHICATASSFGSLLKTQLAHSTHQWLIVANYLSPGYLILLTGTGHGKQTSH